MGSTDFPFVLGPSLQGVALTDEMQATLDGAAAGGAATAGYFTNQFQITKFTTWVNAQGESAWRASTDEHGSPTYVADDGSGTTMVLYTTPATEVIDGADQPQQFTAGGTTYNIVGSLTGTLSYNQQQLWTVTAPLGLGELVGVTTLSGYAWAGLVQPLLAGFLSGVRSCFSGAAEASSLEAAAEVAEVAAEDAAVDAVVVETATVSLTAGVGALAGLAVLIALPFVLDLILHPSFQNLMVYNLTPFDLTWSECFVNEGDMTMAPIVGQGDTALNYLIPAMGLAGPPGITPVDVAHEASFSFASGSLVHGLGYVLCFQATDPTNGGAGAGNLMAMIDVPWSGANSLAVAINSGVDGQAFYEQTSGKYETTQQQATGTLGSLAATATITFDYLQGEHSAPSGGDAYIYNSLLVIETT